MPAMQPYKTYMQQLFKSLEGKDVRRIRASTLALQKWCEVQSWLMASGIEIPSSEALEIGGLIHDNIDKARKLSPAEAEFTTKLHDFFYDKDKQGGAIVRPWIDGKTLLDTGEIRTHGMDDFKVEGKLVTNLEYKTKSNRQIRPVNLAPAVFQTHIYMWIMEPYINMLGYYWKESWVIYLKRERSGDFQPIGEIDVKDYDPVALEEEIAGIFDRFDRAADAKTNAERRAILYPPKKFKCLICAKYSPQLHARCPFQHD